MKKGSEHASAAEYRALKRRIVQGSETLSKQVGSSNEKGSRITGEFRFKNPVVGIEPVVTERIVVADVERGSGIRVPSQK